MRLDGTEDTVGDYTARAARAFDRACQLTGLSASKLCRELSKRLDKERTLSRQTLAAWRHGVQAVPLAAFIATAELAGLRPPVILALAAEEFEHAVIPTDFRDGATANDAEPSPDGNHHPVSTSDHGRKINST